MQIGIIGAGPVGGILSSYIAKDNKIVLVDISKERIDEIKRFGITITGVEQIHTKVQNCVYSISELKDYDVDVVFICVKTCFLEDVIKELKKVNKNMKFISWQNGFDTEELLAESFGRENVLRGIVNYAGKVVRNGEITMTFFNKPNYIGNISPKTENFAKEIAEVLTKSNCETEYTNNIRKYIWEKNILNTALNPICAVTGFTMKEAMENKHTYKIVEKILEEGIEVGNAEGHNFGENFFDYCISYLKKAGSHKPSMLQDIENKKPTEIEFLNAKVVYYGNKYNIPTPYNYLLTNLVRALELRYIK